ncbi:hypothetical protein DFH08DRAFT_387185 [Mycena albidolilacea]|uniref:Uncharacterized protein n=1 Tax=Mycena albidolilacea TaxID=1033008 RepID=A0AAD6ZFK8_9AGAR|nr:hypothetical protein DFH08DRAFT_387185 [Mycena albidolilacea]
MTSGVTQRRSCPPSLHSSLASKLLVLRGLCRIYPPYSHQQPRFERSSIDLVSSRRTTRYRRRCCDIGFLDKSYSLPRFLSQIRHEKISDSSSGSIETHTAYLKSWNRDSQSLVDGIYQSYYTVPSCGHLVYLPVNRTMSAFRQPLTTEMVLRHRAIVQTWANVCPTLKACSFCVCSLDDILLKQTDLLQLTTRGRGLGSMEHGRNIPSSNF